MTDLPGKIAATVSPDDLVERSPALDAEVGEGLLVVDPDRVRAHGLNRSAAAVWRAAGEPATVATVVERVAATLGFGTDVIDADVRAALAQLAAEGLVRLGTQPLPPTFAPHQRPGAFANVPATDEPVPAAFAALAWPAPIGPFRGLDVAFDLTTTDPQLREALAEIWAPLRVDPAALTTTPLRRYQLGPATPPDGDDRGRLLLLALDHHVIARPRSVADALALTVWHANQLVSTATDRFLQLHAAGVVVDGASVVLPASMNSGKSTLATGLVAAGAGYLTDETVAIVPGRGTILAYPKAVSLDPGSWPLFPTLEPPFLRDAPDLAHRKWYVAPDAIRAGAAIAPGTGPDGTPVADIPIGAVVLPRYDPGGPTALERLAPLDAAAALAANAFNLLALGQAGVDELVRLATVTPCWRLTVADLDAGVAEVLAAARA